MRQNQAFLATVHQRDLSMGKIQSTFFHFINGIFCMGAGAGAMKPIRGCVVIITLVIVH